MSGPGSELWEELDPGPLVTSPLTEEISAAYMNKKPSCR